MPLGRYTVVYCTGIDFGSWFWYKKEGFPNPFIMDSRIQIKMMLISNTASMMYYCVHCTNNVGSGERDAAAYHLPEADPQ